MLNKEYEAGVREVQGRKLSMYEKPGVREVMGKSDPDGKHDKVNVVRERVNTSAWKDMVDKDTVGHGDDDEVKTAGKYLHEKPEVRDGMTDINPKSK